MDRDSTDSGLAVGRPTAVAIDAHIEERRRDKDFKERLRRRHEEGRARYERLAK